MKPAPEDFEIPGNAPRWVIIDITTLDLPDDSYYYGPSPYHDSIPWAEANRVARTLITPGAKAELVFAPSNLPEPVLRGVEALLAHPAIEVVDGIVYRGGHRLRAMRRQGVERTIGTVRDTNA